MGRTLRPIRRCCFLLLPHDQSTRLVTAAGDFHSNIPMSPTRLWIRADSDSRSSSSGETGQSLRPSGPPHPVLIEFLPPQRDWPSGSLHHHRGKRFHYLVRGKVETRRSTSSREPLILEDRHGLRNAEIIYWIRAGQRSMPATTTASPTSSRSTSRCRLSGCGVHSASPLLSYLRYDHGCIFPVRVGQWCMFLASHVAGTEAAPSTRRDQGRYLPIGPSRLSLVYLPLAFLHSPPRASRSQPAGAAGSCLRASAGVNVMGRTSRSHWRPLPRCRLAQVHPCPCDGQRDCVPAPPPRLAGGGGLCAPAMRSPYPRGGGRRRRVHVQRG
ncbi:hypothetical protein B0H11DRAFT_1207501 [Mycena galericulata]|nr:hypothetical protein B0H11DRAFT_1207501 [Mycena galericulata]